MNRTLVYVAAVVLAILHHDFWLWDDATLVFGFLPAGMAYHAAYTVATAGLWYLALRYAWPDEAVRFAEGSDDPGAESK